MTEAAARSPANRIDPAPDPQRSPCFDAAWYARAHPECGGPGRAFAHYIDTGVALGHAPSPIFDADWYLATHPDAQRHAAGILGHYLDAAPEGEAAPNPWFDTGYYTDIAGPEALADPAGHFLRAGLARGLAPHPLFDADWVRRQVPGLSPAINPYWHFVSRGFPEGIDISPLFEGAWYRTAHGLPAGMSPLLHYLSEGAAAGLRASRHFDTAWYMNTYGHHLAPGTNPLVHYVRHGDALGWTPTKHFDVVWYRTRYGVPKGRSAMADYRHRRAAGQERRPNAAFSPAHYRKAHMAGAPADASELEHYEDHGETAGNWPDLPVARLAASCGAEAAGIYARLLRRHRIGIAAADRCAAPLSDWEVSQWREAVRAGLPAGPPRISIVIPVHNQIAFTTLCVEAIVRTAGATPYEIIIAEDRSTDGTAERFAGLGPALRVVPNAAEQGFVGNCNHAAAHASGEIVLFLNNDTVPLPGWLDEIAATFDAEPAAGILGARLLFADGKLQESGGIIWETGAGWNFGRAEDPLTPETCYLRPADYVSGAALAVRHEVWDALGGFDTLYAPAYCEDSDLCLRARAAGWEVLVQPAASVVHFEGSSHDATETGASAMKLRSLERFRERWLPRLSGHGAEGEAPARAAHRHSGERILVVDAVTPNPREDAGSITCLEILRGFRALGLKVTFVAADNLLYMPRETGDLQREGIETIYRPFYRNLPDFLARRGGEFDHVMVFRCGMACRFLPEIFAHAPQARVIFHNSDMHALRQVRAARLGEALPEAQTNLHRLLADEMYAMHGAAVTVLHSTHERDLLARIAPAVTTHVYPWTYEARPGAAGFGDRAGLAFLGGFRHPPNVDAVEHFVADIWPLARDGLEGAAFDIIGSHPPEALAALDDGERIRLAGYVPELGEHFDRLRVSVVPLRYGAGLKGKIVTAMAHGVPVVTTSCGAEGMGLRDGEAVLIRDDPASFADAVVALHSDPDLWARLREAGLAHVRETYSTQAGRAHLARILELARGGSTIPAALLGEDAAG